MPSKLHHGLLAGLLAGLLSPAPASAASDLATLFTTPQERQLINANRYKREEVKPSAQVEQPEETPIQLVVVKEEVSVDYQVSGISLAADGAHTVWINAVAYEDGARLEDGSRVRIQDGNPARVRITAPDGRHYFATSGETLTVTYQAAVEN